jgi:hypothetical protein
MKFRGLLVAIVVLAALGGTLYWSQHHLPVKQKTNADTDLPFPLTINPGNVSGLTLTEKGSAPITLISTQPGRWQIVTPIDTPADTASVAHILSDLAHIRAQEIVEDHAANLNRYGLDNPSLTLDINQRNNEKAELILGDRTPTGTGAYAMVPGDAHVYTIPYFMEETFNKPFDDLRDKRVLPFAEKVVSNIEIDKGKQIISVDRKHAGWQIQKPGVYPTAGNKVDNLLHTLVAAKFDSSVSPAEAAAAFAQAPPLEVIKLTAGSGNNTEVDTLDVHKSSDGAFYAKASVYPGACMLDPSIAHALLQDLDDLREKRVLDVGVGMPLNIDYHSPAATVALVRSNNDWYQNGKPMDGATVQALIDVLRGLSATHFATAGFTHPDTDLTVVAFDGAAGKIHFQRTKDGGALAKRDDGPTVYVLDADAMNTLTAAIGSLQPASALPNK